MNRFLKSVTLVHREELDSLAADRNINLDGVEYRTLTIQGDQCFLRSYWTSTTFDSITIHGVFLFKLRDWGMILASSARCYGRVEVQRKNPPSKLAFATFIVAWYPSPRVGPTMDSNVAFIFPFGAELPLSHFGKQRNTLQPEAIQCCSAAGILAHRSNQRVDSQLGHQWAWGGRSRPCMEDIPTLLYPPRTQSGADRTRHS